MRIKKKSKSKRIKEAAIRDGINYIAGLSGIPFPLGVVEELVRMRKEGSPPNFVDWQLEDWPQIYINELNSAVQLFYRGKEYLLPQVLILNNIERKLDLSQIGFKLEDKPFELKDNIRALTEVPFKQLVIYLRKKRRYSNEQNLRLINILEEKDGAILKVQPVEYKYYVHTNLVLDAKSKEKEQTLREYLHSDGKLEKLKESLFANHLGINILLFTADGSLIMQERSGEVAFRTKELCPAASGTVSFTDVPTEITLEKMPKLREAFGEIGIIKTDIPTNQIFFLGITRELIRGGQPEMFFFGKTNLSEKQIRDKWEDAKDKWESKKLVFFHFGQIAHKDLINVMEKHKFLSKIDEFIDKYINKLSIPLLTSVALWIKYRMEANSDG